MTSESIYDIPSDLDDKSIYDIPFDLDDVDKEDYLITFRSIFHNEAFLDQEIRNFEKGRGIFYDKEARETFHLAIKRLGLCYSSVAKGFSELSFEYSFLWKRAKACLYLAKLCAFLSCEKLKRICSPYKIAEIHWHIAYMWELSTVRYINSTVGSPDLGDDKSSHNVKWKMVRRKLWGTVLKRIIYACDTMSTLEENDCFADIIPLLEDEYEYINSMDL